ncbi:hypothetical protein VZT92_002590 [Zoarces viviparus]|uniref:Uncharacterized protein n=1 Tax=Zoarces viviparus TaxID=48416 RepID=A0AAW1FZU7_ZOAVI
MEYCFLTGFLVVLLIQHCTSEDPSTSIQSSTAVTVQDGPAIPQEPELPPAEVVPAVVPPSLKEVQQAVQEASEQVESRGAEEVLKELLERVVEAAWGQVEVGGEAKADEEAVREAAEEDALEADKGWVETDTKAEVLEQAVEEAEGKDMDAEGGYNGAGEEQEVAVVDALEVVAEEGEGVVEGEGEAKTGSVEETTAGVEEERVEVIDESLGNEVSQGIVEDTMQRIVEDAVAALEETEGYLEVGEAGAEDGEEQAVLSEEKVAAETETQEVEETPAVMEVAGDGEPETVVESDPSLAVAGVEQIEDLWLNEGTQVDKMEGDAIVPHIDNLEIETTQTVVGEPVEEINIVNNAEGPEVEDEQGHLLVGGGAAEDFGAEGTEVGEESVIKGESVALANEAGDQQAGEEEQIALETSHGSEKEDQEVPVISAPEPEDGDEASMELSPENQALTPRPSLGGVEPGENALGEETPNNGNEIIAPTVDLSPHDPVEAQPTLDHFVKDVLAEPPQAEGEEPGEANELVEDAAGNKETREQGLEAWKIGAISAAAFLVLETVIIIIYILKCRNKNSTPAFQRACEEGCVEPEAAMGGDCSDDTLPAGNGDAQQIAALDTSDAASTLARNKEQNEEERAIAMSNLPPSSAEESASIGPGPDSSQDLRTSIL